MTTFHGTLVVASIVLCAIYSNSPSLAGDFVFDDSEAIQGNNDVTGNSSIAEVFKHDFWGNNIRTNRSHKSYRPLTVLTFRLDAWLSGELNPVVFHTHNLILYSAVCLLYRHTVERLSGSRETADWSAVLFATHPIHTEVVSSVVGRAEMTSSLFYLTAVLCWRESIRGKGVKWLIVTGVVAGIGMLCKEQSVTVLGVCALWEFLLVCVGRKDWGVKWYMCRCVVYLVAAVSVLSLRWSVMAGTTPKFQRGDNPASFASDWLTRAMNYSYIWALNAYLLALPFWLCFDWSMGCVPLIETIWDIRNAASALLFLFIATLAWRCVVELRNARNVELTAGLVAVLVPFLPASNLLFRVGFVVAERILFLSSMGSCFLVASGALRVKWFRAGMVFLSVLFIVRSNRRSSDWLREESLYRSGLTVCPSNAKVHYNVANVVSQIGHVAEAEERYREAVRLFPEYDQALNNLGNLLREKGELKEAHECLSTAVIVSPEFAAGWMNKGIVELNLKRFDQSEQSLLNAIRFRKRYPDALYNLGNLYLETGERELAVRAFKDTIHLKKDHRDAWVNLCLYLEESVQLEEAESAVNEAISVFPADHYFLYSKANILGKQSRFYEAERMYLRALKMDPLNHKYHGNLGVLYHLWGRLEVSEESYKRSLELRSDDVTIRQNYKKLLNKRRSSNH